MTKLTNEMIIRNFNTNMPFMEIILIYLVAILVIFGIIYFLKLKKEQSIRKKRGQIIVLIIILLLIGIPTINGILEYDAINYSLKNNSWYVEKDTVARTRISRDDEGDETCYVYLTNYGKVSVDRRTYYNITKGDTVYVVIAKGRFGGTYVTSQIYPANKYTY